MFLYSTPYPMLKNTLQSFAISKIMLFFAVLTNP
nr:MAG TPA: hypothetical protein [Caudoviricetes sp.]